MKKKGIVAWSVCAFIMLRPLVAEGASGGLILKKDRPWSTTVSEILPFIAERARGYNDSGYKSYFVDRNGKILSVENSLIVSIITYPDLNEFQNITSEASLSALLSKKAELQEVSAKFPQAKQYLANPITSLDAEISRFRSGERKLNGKWLTGTEYQKIQADSAAAEALAKAQREKRIAAEKATEEQRRLEQEAIAKKSADERAAAERERVEKEKNMEANLAKATVAFEAAERSAAERYQTSSRGKLSGQIFVPTRGGENFKLGAVQVALFAREAVDVILAGLREYAEVKRAQLKDPLAAAKAGHESADATEKALFDASLKSIGQSNYSQMEKQVSAAREAAGTASNAYSKISQEFNGYRSGNFYFDFLQSPIQSVETDADGKFLIEVPLNGSFVIAARAKRSVGEETERYYWLAPVSMEGQRERVQNLSNSNLTTAAGTSALILTKD